MPPAWRRWSRVLLAIALVAAVAAIAFHRPLLRTLGRTLVMDDPIQSADVIVVPLWSGGAGAIEAADLVQAGMANRVAVLAGPPRAAERELIRRGVAFKDGTTDLVELLRALGVADVEVIPNTAGGTEAEGQVLPPWCDDRKLGAIIVVSAPDHSRRLRRVLERSMHGRPTRFMIRGTRFSSFDPDHWWETRDNMRVGIVELQKLLLDVVRHPIG